jgi:geranylgeranyl diphosphate synthase type II
MTGSLPFQTYLHDLVEEVELAFHQLFPQEWSIENSLIEAMNYSLFAGGKRIRPVLLLSAIECLGKPRKLGLAAACSVEMIHTYSLIHDDLPAMDNDDLRRGKPTNHIVFGEAIAILAGDGLLSHAFYVLGSLQKEGNLTDAQILQTVTELSKCAGLYGMVSGQAADMNGVQGVTSIEDLKAIHRQKTGALIACSLKIGGIIGGANEHQLDALEQFGYQIGLAFQIQDDVLDLTGNVGKIGKPIRSDEKSNKVTYPFFLGVEGSREEIVRLTKDAKQRIEDAEFPDPTRLFQLADFLIARDH